MQAEACFELFFNRSRNPTWVVDRQLHLVAANPLAKEYFYQYNSAQLELGMDMLAVMRTDVRLFFGELYYRALAGETFTNSRHFDIQGNVLHFDLVFTPVNDERGDVKACLVTAYEKAGSTAHLTLLAESELRLKHALENSQDGLFDWNLETNEVFYSLRWKAMLGYTDEELPNELSSWDSLLHPDDREATLNKVNEHLEGRSDLYRADFRLREKSGRYRWIRARGKAVNPDVAGNPRRFIGTQIDIDDEKRRERQQAAHEKLLRGLLEASTLLLHESDLSVSLLKALELIGEAAEADRIHLFKYLGNTQCVTRYRWQAGQPAREYSWHPQQHEMPVFDLPQRWYAVLATGELLGGPVATFPEDEQGFLSKHNILRVLMVPIFTGNNPWGYMAIDDLHTDSAWHLPNVDVIRNFALAIGAAKAREYNERDLLRLSQNLEEAQQIARMGSFEFDYTNSSFFWSRETSMLLGLPEEAIANLETIQGKVHPDDKDRFEQWGSALTAAIPFHTEFRMRAVHGQTRFLEVRGRPIADENGSITRMAGTLQDVSQQRSAEQAIRQFEKMVEVSPDQIALIDMSGRYFYLNPAAADFLGIGKAEEAYGSNYLDYAEIDFGEQVENQILPALWHAGYWEGELNRTHPRLGKRVLLTSIFVIYDQKYNTPSSVAVFQHDITDRKRDELALADHAKKVEAINTELDRFAYIVSHDLKAPLRAIQNLSSWIVEDLGDQLDEETQQNMQLLQQRVQKMSDMIEGILRYSRAGRFKGEPSTFYLNVLVKELVDQMNGDTHISLELPANDRLVRTDKLAMEQVFTNLVSNAVRYGSRAGETEVKITVEEQGDFLTIGVHDNGEGLAAGFHEQIFEIFRTAGETKHQDSHGIGLSIVKKIVSDQGGKIWLESEPGKGAHFYFTWPKGE